MEEADCKHEDFEQIESGSSPNSGQLEYKCSNCGEEFWKKVEKRFMPTYEAPQPGQRRYPGLLVPKWPEQERP